MVASDSDSSASSSVGPAPMKGSDDVIRLRTPLRRQLASNIVDNRPLSPGEIWKPCHHNDFHCANANAIYPLSEGELPPLMHSHGNQSFAYNVDSTHMSKGSTLSLNNELRNGIDVINVSRGSRNSVTYHSLSISTDPSDTRDETNLPNPHPHPVDKEEPSLKGIPVQHEQNMADGPTVNEGKGDGLLPSQQPVILKPLDDTDDNDTNMISLTFSSLSSD